VYLEFEDNTAYHLSVYHYNLHDNNYHHECQEIKNNEVYRGNR